MSLISGVGYKAIGSTVYWIRPGGGQVATTEFYPFSGNPFAGREIDIVAFRKRYGANTSSGRYELLDGTVCSFPVDAESIGILSRAMELAAKSGKYSHEFRGTPSTHTMVPTHLETHDYAATHPDGGRSLMAAMGVGGGGSGSGASGSFPGRPRIDRASSPAPGLIDLQFITSEADRFEVNIETETDDGPGWNHSIPDPKTGYTRKIQLEVPDYISGLCIVKVRAYRGASSGPWSLSKRVDIKKSDKLAGIDPVAPVEEKKNPILIDPVSRSAMATLILKSYTKDQIIEAFEMLTSTDAYKELYKK